MKVETNTLTTDLFLELYASVGWEPPCREQVECALQNTMASFVAYEGGESNRYGKALGRWRNVILYKRFCSFTKVSGDGSWKAASYRTAAVHFNTYR